MPRRRLHISTNFSLLVDAITETFWFSGKRGSGKTHNCTVLVEEILKAGGQVVILDSMRAWYGLRSSVDGKHAGIPILICGGPHGDMPLNPLGGVPMAEFAVREGVSMILDMRDWSKGQRARFVKDFLLRLLQINEEAMHVVFEEAPRFAPQNPDKGIEAAEMLGAVIDFVQTGRGMGLGGSLISQRSANLNSNVRSQTSVLVAHKANYKLDIDAMNDWFIYHESPLAATAKARIPHLPVGTALMASIELFGDEDSLREVVFRPRETFDSSSTPKFGERKRVAKTMAEIDISAISEQMSAMVEEAKANDPRELKAEVARLRAQVATLEARPAQIETKTEIKTIEKTIEIETIDPHLGSLIRDLGWKSSELDDIAKSIEEIARLAKVAEDSPKRTDKGTTERTEQASITPKRQVAASPKKDTQPTAIAVPRGSVAITPPSNGIKIGKGEKTVLAVLREWPDGVENRSKLCFLTGFSKASSTIDARLSMLRKAGYVEPGQPIRLTPLGVQASGGLESKPRGRELLDYWMQHKKVGEGERKTIRALMSTYPRDISRDELCALADFSPASSTIDARLSGLRKLGIVEKGHRRLAEDFATEIGL